MIRRLQLTNFRKHGRLDENFGGITAIIGPNGAGKSTILDAIELALYPDHFHTVAHNVKKGQKEAKVELEVSANGHTLTFNVSVRTQGKKMQHRVTSESLQVIEHDDARRKVGLPGSLREFEILHYVRQGVLSTSPKVIANTVRRILGIDKIKKVVEVLRGIEKDLGKELENFQRSLPLIDAHFQSYEVVELGDLERRINQLDREIRELECEVLFLMGRKKRNERMIEELESEIKSAEERERKLQKKIEEKRKLEGKKKALIEDVERLKKELQDLKVKVSEGENVESVRRRREKVREDRETVIETHARLKKLRKDLEKKRRELERIHHDVGGYLSVIGEAEPEEVEILRNYSTAKVEFEKTEEAYDEYERLTKERQEIDKKLERLREVWRLLKEMERLKGEIEEAFGRLPSLNEYDRELKDLRTKVANLNAKLDHEKKRLEALKGGAAVCPVCGREIPDPQALLKETEKNVGELGGKLEEVERELKKYEGVKDRVQRYHNLTDRVKEILKDLDGIDLPTDAPLDKLREAVEWIGKELNRRKGEVEGRLKDLKEDYEKHISAKRRMEEYGTKLPIAPSDLKIEDFARMPEWVPKKYEEMKRVEGEIKRWEEDIKRNEEELEKVRRRYPEAGESLKGYLESLEDDLERKEEYLKKDEERKEKEMELRELENRLRALGNPEEELEELKESIQAMRQEKEERGEMLSDIKVELEGKKKDMEDRKETVRKLKDKHGEWKEKLFLKERVRLMREKIEEKKEIFIKSRKRVFEIKVERYFLGVFGHGVSYSKLQLDDDLMPILTLHNGEKVSVSYGQRMGTDQIALSGGEKTAMYLSYIMALREIEGKERGVAPVLLLDEPTTHLDAERREDVWQMLDTLHREKGIQIIVVTHDTQSFNSALGGNPNVHHIIL